LREKKEEVHTRAGALLGKALVPDYTNLREEQTYIIADIAPNRG